MLEQCAQMAAKCVNTRERITSRLADDPEKMANEQLDRIRVSIYELTNDLFKNLYSQTYLRQQPKECTKSGPLRMWQGIRDVNKKGSNFSWL